MTKILDFEKCRTEAERILESLNLKTVFRKHFPDYIRHVKATKKEDLAGTDYLVISRSGKHRVDIKLMLQKTPWPDTRRDNLPVEVFSVKERGIMGYGGDANYVLWLYRDSLNSSMVPREELRQFVEKKWEGLSLFCELHEKKTRMRSGYVYTSIFFWLPRWVVEKIGQKECAVA